MKTVLCFILLLPIQLLANTQNRVDQQIIQWTTSSNMNHFYGWDIFFSSSNLRTKDFTHLFHHQKRPFYKPWAKHPKVEEDLLQKDLESLSRSIELKGYYDHSLKPGWKLKKNDIGVLSVNVHLGEPFTVNSVLLEFYGYEIKTEKEQEELKSITNIKKGDRFSEVDYQKAITNLKTHFLQKGHYWVTVEPKVQLSKKSKECSIRIQITPGPVCYFDDLVIKANSAIPTSLIKREILLNSGDIFSPEAIIESRKALIRTRWFRLVILKVDDSTTPNSPTLPLILQLEDAEHRSIQIGLGFGSEEGPRFKGAWTHRHFLKKGWKQTIENRLSPDRMSLKLGLEVPRAFRHRGFMRNEFEIGQDEEEDYDLEKTTLSSRWTYALSPRQNVHLEFNIKYLNHQPDPSLKASLGNPSDQALISGPKILIDRQWSKENHLLQIQSHHSIEGLLDVHDLGSGLWRTMHGINLSLPFPYSWSMFCKSQAGWIGEIPGQTPPISERYYSGGSGSVRGYERRSLGPRSPSDDRMGGTALWEASIELRRSIFIDELVYALFYDLGQLDLRNTGLQFSDFRTAWGMGIGYKMEVGLMRIDVGIPNARREWENPFQIHIDFGLSL